MDKNIKQILKPKKDILKQKMTWKPGVLKQKKGVIYNYKR